MRAFVSKDIIETENSSISFDTFNLLTSKYIDFTKRQNQCIHIYRDNGHIYIYDTTPILGEIYKSNLNNKLYKCSKNVESGEFILESINKNDPTFIVIHKDEIKNYSIAPARRRK